jgi:carbon starvation protein CstA
MEEPIKSDAVGQTLETIAAASPSKEVYTPSSTEKKRAVMMYLLIGIIVVALNNQKKSDFESFHLKQALGWWAIFLLLVVATSVFMLLPIIKYLPIFLVVVMVVFMGIFIKRARDGKYTIEEQSKMAIFHALGGRIMTLFEVKMEEPKKEMKNE